jgi:hypothetical protein
MSLDIDERAIRRLDLASFTGDAWADDPTLAVPDVGVARFVADGSPVEVSVYAVASGSPDADQVIDTTTTVTVCMVKISRVRDKARVRALMGSSGALLGHELTEPDVKAGDVFSIGIPAIAVGTAPWLEVVVHSGFSTILAPEAAP